MLTRTALAIFTAVAIYFPTPVVAAKACYAAAGNQDANLFACDPSAVGASACCPDDHLCYSNGLCQKEGVERVNSTVLTVYTAYGCSDFDSTMRACAAFQQCKSSGVGITACGSNTYCCYGLKGCSCSNSTQVFTLSAGSIITTVQSTATRASTSTTSRSSSTSSGSATATAASSGGSSNAVAIGVGVGVGAGVGIILLAGLGFWFWRRHRKNKKAAAGPPVETTQKQPSPDPETVPAYREYYNSADAKYASVPQSDPSAATKVQPQNQELLASTQQPVELDAPRNPVQIDTSREVKPS